MSHTMRGEGMARAPRRLHHAAAGPGPRAEHAPLPACSARHILCAAMCARVPRPAQHAARRTARPTHQGNFEAFQRLNDKYWKGRTAREKRAAKKAAQKAGPKAAPACDMLCLSLPPCPALSLTHTNARAHTHVRTDTYAHLHASTHPTAARPAAR